MPRIFGHFQVICLCWNLKLLQKKQVTPAVHGNSILLSSVLKALILLPTEGHYHLHLLDFNHTSIYKT